MRRSAYLAYRHGSPRSESLLTTTVLLDRQSVYSPGEHLGSHTRPSGSRHSTGDVHRHRSAPHPGEGVRADEHPGRPRRGRGVTGRLLPLLRFKGGAARSGRRAHGGGRDLDAGAAHRRPGRARPAEASGRLHRDRPLEGGADGAHAGAPAGLAFGRERDRAREVPPRPGGAPRAAAGRDRPPGRRRGRLPVELPRRPRTRAGLAATGSQRDGRRALRRPPGRQGLVRGRRAPARDLRRSLRTSPGTSLRVAHAGRPGGPARVVRLTMDPEGATAITATPATPATSATPAIRAEKLTKSYGKSRGIVALDLEVQAGEVFGFLGPNGAGKTTTIRVLLDLIRPTTGRVLVLGRDSHRDTLAIQI